MAAGLIDFAITWRADIYGGAAQASSAADFGTLGITFRARMPRDEQEWLDTVRAAQSCVISSAS